MPITHPVNSPRKPRLLNSPFDALSARQTASVAGWFVSAPKLTYAAASRRLKRRYGIKVSIQSMASFWYREVRPILTRKTSGLAGKIVAVDVRIQEGDQVFFEGTANLPIGPKGKGRK